MRLTAEQVEHIVREVEAVDYGRLVIEINAEASRLDVVTERRTRFIEGVVRRPGARTPRE